MGKLRVVTDIETDNDAKRWAKRFENSNECEICEGHSHTIVRNGRGMCVIPRHGNHEMPKGTRRSVIKMFIAMGLTLLALFILTQIVAPDVIKDALDMLA